MTRHKQFRSDGVGARKVSRGRRVACLLAVLVPLAILLATAGTASAEGNRVEVAFSCNSVTWTYSEFPAGAEVKVVERIKVDKKVVSITNFTFIGPSATSTVKYNVPPGHHEIGTTAEYRFKGVFFEHDQGLQGGITCETNPDFTIEKRQMIAGSGNPFTTAELTGQIGQVVNYQMIVTNTGNTSLKFSNFSDPKCDGGTIAGGPGETAVLPLKSTTYTCSHKLTKDGKYSNAATVTGKPPPEFCVGACEITKSSNTVVTDVPNYTIEKLQEIAGSGSGYTKSQLGAEVGATVNYKIVVTNVGEVPIKFSSFTDEKCDGGTIAGGPGPFPVLPGESTTYTCTHLVTEADKTAGLLINTATDTGTPEGEEPETLTSNQVIVEVPLPKPSVKPEFSCKSVTFNFSGFPNKNGNEVVERIKDNGVLIYSKPFVFNGPTASNTVVINLGPGSHHISTTVEYKTIHGQHDQGADVVCTAEPEFTIEKKQRILKGGGPFTTATLTSEVGKTVEYLIIVKNTGNVPLKFSNFMDELCTGETCGVPEGCDPGTITGGPGEAAVPPEKPKVSGKTEWKCTHLLTEEDREFGKHQNKATVTGTPEGGAPKTKTSNTVVVIDP